MSDIDTSGIDATKPADNSNALTADIRQNWTAIKNALDTAATELDQKLLSSLVSSFMLTLLDDTSASQARTTLGLGSLSTQSTINDGDWSGADLSLLNGGTGQSTAQAAIDALTQVSAATNEHVLTKDTGTGNATWKAASTAADSIGQDEIDTTSLNPIVQLQSTFDGTAASGTTTIPNDNTIPQNTEGDEYITVSITPTSATNKLIISAKLHLTHSGTSSEVFAALFQDSTANALASTWAPKDASAGAPCVVDLTYIMTAGTASATTFKIRAGAAVAGTTYFNSFSGTAKFNGTLASYISVIEVMQ
jgi:hypothetical protein